MTRIICDADDCQRTIGRERYVRQLGHEPGGWICPTHWKLVPRALKRLNARHNRERRRYGQIVRPEAYARLWRAIWKVLEIA